MMGREVLEYDPAHVLMSAVDLPFSSQVIRASRKEPDLGFILDLDSARIAELATRVFPHGAPKPWETRALYVGPSTDAIVDAGARLLDLMAAPDDGAMLGPLVVDESAKACLRTNVRRTP